MALLTPPQPVRLLLTGAHLISARMTCTHGKCRRTVVFEDSDFSEHYKNPDGIQGGCWVRVYKKECQDGHPNIHEVKETDPSTLECLRREQKVKQEELAKPASQVARQVAYTSIRFEDEVSEDDAGARVLRTSFAAVPGGKKTKKGSSTPPDRSFRATSARNKPGFVRVNR